MAFRLIPREEKFYADFQALADEAGVSIDVQGEATVAADATLFRRAVSNLASNALTLVDYWRYTEKDVLIHALPIFHVHGLFVALNTCLSQGAKILWRQKFDGEAVVRSLPEATLFMGVPTFYTRLLSSQKFGKDTCRNMRLFVSGSAPLLAETHQEFRARTGHARSSNACAPPR